MSTVHARWYPATVRFTDPRHPWARCYVLVADDGLHVFRRRSEVADWYSPIIWSLTTLPTTDRQARRGVDVQTDAGLVVVTPGSGCRCGGMGSWSGPSWARAEAAGTVG